MIDEPRLDAYRRIVDEEHDPNDDIDDIARQIEELQRERRIRQQQSGGGMIDTRLESTLDHGQEQEPDPYATLSTQELDELELSPAEIDFTALSAEQQVRYWSLLSPGEKLMMVRLHLQLELEDIAYQLELPVKVLRLLEADKFALLPSATAVRAYYRVYAEAIGINSEQLVQQYEMLSGQSQQQQPKSPSFASLTSFKPWQSKFFLMAGAALILGVVLVVLAVNGFSEQKPQYQFVPDNFQPVTPAVSSLGAEASTPEVDQKANTGVTYEPKATAPLQP